MVMEVNWMLQRRTGVAPVITIGAHPLRGDVGA